MAASAPLPACEKETGSEQQGKTIFDGQALGCCSLPTASSHHHLHVTMGPSQSTVGDVFNGRAVGSWLLRHRCLHVAKRPNQRRREDVSIAEVVGMCSLMSPTPPAFNSNTES